ncbi:hypothetical protein, partial [Escherichia coli]|uniref:hypothetical protein n=1 Tax=Escherichia coli TaxID=562 RepID=UPI001C4FC1A1
TGGDYIVNWREIARENSKRSILFIVNHSNISLAEKIKHINLITSFYALCAFIFYDLFQARVLRLTLFYILHCSYKNNQRAVSN